MEFVGFLVTDNGVKPTKRMTEAILHFPTSTSVTGSRSWFGLVNQVSYAFSQAEVMALFLELLKTKNRKFYWNEILERLFQESKKVRVRKLEKGLRMSEMNRATGLAIDNSKTCISYFQFQKSCRCSSKLNMGCGHGHWKIILTGSLFAIDTESRYKPLEGEALPLVYGLVSCRMFILGCPDLPVTVDPLPSVKYFRTRAWKILRTPAC